MLEFIDHELIEDFTHQLRDRGVALRFGAKVEGIEIENDWPVTILEGGRRVRSEMVLYTAGRVGATEALNLESCGLTADDRGRLKVDPQTFQTTAPHIYCAGDAIGFPSLASTSMEQGRIAACHAFGVPAPHAPEFFPYGIYSVPEISTVGMSEQEVRTRGIPYECGVARFRETSRGHIMGLNAGMMKMLFSLKSRRLLGVHIVGEGRHRADPYRSGGAEPERHAGLLHREHIQLSDAGRGLQDRRVGCMEPDGGVNDP